MPVPRSLKGAVPEPRDAVRVLLGERLAVLLDPGASRLFLRLEGVMRHFSREMGIQIPVLSLARSVELEPEHYELHFLGQLEVEGRLLPGRVLAVGEEEALAPLLGEAGQEPVYGMPGKWIPASHARGALELGCMVFEPEAMLVTHLVSLLERQAWRLIDTDAVAARLEVLKGSQPHLVAEARRRLGLARIRTILANIARERISVSDLSAVLEAALGKAGRAQDPQVLTELARTGLRRAICRAFSGEDGLEAITLSESAEKLLAREFKRDNGLDALVGQRFLAALALEYEAAMEKGTRPVLLVDFELRPLVAGLTERVFPELPVLSWTEVDPDVEVETVAVLGSRFHPSARPYPSRRWIYS